MDEATKFLKAFDDLKITKIKPTDLDKLAPIIITSFKKILNSIKKEEILAEWESIKFKSLALEKFLDEPDNKLLERYQDLYNRVKKKVWIYYKS